MPDIPQNSQQMLDNIAIVLKTPKYPENIGAAARCALNMGISRLIVVHDHTPDEEKMLKMATHKAAPLIENLQLFADLEEALAPFAHVVGTTARKGRKRPIENSPRAMLNTILPLLQNNQVALLFGPEDRGLTNEDLKYCQTRVTIPTADFSSLNLAQAVAIIAYEIFWGVMYGDKILRSVPRLANSKELDGMYDHVEELLTRIGFLKTNDTTYWIRNIRNFLGRVELRAKEARIIRGFCRQFLWYDDRHDSPGADVAPPHSSKACLESAMHGDKEEGRKSR